MLSVLSVCALLKTFFSRYNTAVGFSPLKDVHILHLKDQLVIDLIVISYYWVKCSLRISAKVDSEPSSVCDNVILDSLLISEQFGHFLLYGSGNRFCLSIIGA